MDLILDDFLADLSGVIRLVALIDEVGVFSATAPPAEEATDEYSIRARIVHTKAAASLQDHAILRGTLILYVSGRFESYVRTEFEDMCDRICSSSQSYDKLPRPMRVNLIKMTAHLMMDDQRVDHTGTRVQGYVTTLASNLSDRTKLDTINSECLSITTKNMRAETISQLFERVGATDILEMIGQQAAVQLYFSTRDPAHAVSEIKKRLNKLMDLRNKIAHPSTSLAWPSVETVRDYIEFITVVARAMSQVTDVYAVTLATS
jgi:hypothetical protein